MPEQAFRRQRANHPFWTSGTIATGLFIWCVLVAIVAVFIGWPHFDKLRQLAGRDTQSSQAPGREQVQESAATEEALHDELYAVGAVAAFLIGLPLLTWGAWIRHRQTDVSQDTQLTDFLTKAIEQLGATREEDSRHVLVPEQRLGAIYALERIALTDERDARPIADMLAAYARHRSKELRRDSYKEGETAGANDETNPEGLEPFNPLLWLDDIRSALLAIEKLMKNRASSFPREGVSEMDLKGLYLPAVELANLHLFNCRLDESSFEGARVRGVVFERAEIREANFKNCSILADLGDRDAVNHSKPLEFRACQLVKARFDSARLRGILFHEVQASGALFRKANFTAMVAGHGTNFKAGDFSKATSTAPNSATAISRTPNLSMLPCGRLALSKLMQWARILSTPNWMDWLLAEK
jgi:uncharacterized protein YjbI with pentapeptide repeats